MLIEYWDTLIDHLEDKHGVIVNELDTKGTTDTLTVDFSINKEGVWAQEIETMTLDMESPTNCSVIITGTRTEEGVLSIKPANKYTIFIQANA